MRIDRLSLIGTSRTITFKAGLNLVYGPISTGKTSVLRLCRIALGAPVGSLPPEIELLPALGARIDLRGVSYELVRYLNRSATAPVEIARDNSSMRLGALQATTKGERTYGQWLLAQLGLPQLEVPSAPTRPDSDPTNVSINDYFAYCDLPKEEIRSQVFGHRHPFKDIKRKYVFEILYGLFDTKLAVLQNSLRMIRKQIRVREQAHETIQKLLAGTAWENRAAIAQELADLQLQDERLASSVASTAHNAPRSSNAVEMRNQIAKLDQLIAKIRIDISRERADTERLLELAEQLDSQIARLTRALVAREELLNFEFVICPRCGTDVQRDKVDELHCYLCLQKPTSTYGHRDLVTEQDRLATQLGETRTLISTREQRSQELEKGLSELQEERTSIGTSLDHELKTFISDSAASLQNAAAERASLRERIHRLRDYMTLFTRADGIATDLAKLRDQEREALIEIENADYRSEVAEGRMRQLEETLTSVLRELALPGFLGDPVAHIDRGNYLPVVSGRTFDTLQSEGLSVEVNIAHALAHHINAIKNNLPLPGVLFIDGISGAFGERGYDPARAESIYAQLERTCASFGDRLQVIVADTRIPESARDFIRLELNEAERLIPESDLGRLREDVDT